MNHNNIEHKYDDIINLPHHVSAKHPHLSIHDRAAQFAPFAALVGYDDNIDEAGRLTAPKIELDENSKQLLDEKLNFIMEHKDNNIELNITYYIPDSLKEGGSYTTISAIIKKIDTYNKTLVMHDLTVIPIGDITDITSPNFNEFEY